jgi:hypothetical protein
MLGHCLELAAKSASSSPPGEQAVGYKREMAVAIPDGQRIMFPSRSKGSLWLQLLIN